MLNMKVKMIKIKRYQLKNILIKLDYVSSKGNDEEQVMHSKSNNIEIMINDEADKVIKKTPFKSIENRYQNNLKLMICL